ncbi:Uu.00g040280.m01.CDS01 [Anthostomella pinea]|uniref:Molybdopterin synthase sulfur carrier subunit n=1 Tax=Anthostomella pinea TaxID=933095 RepID=A0AAI8VB51_9PEZI|nr:Uu.00g040280.m01.CDS01 [Anthostomella pinea]
MGAVPKAPKGSFNVLYFASASSFTSREYETLPAPLPLHKLFEVLEERYTGIREKILSSCLVTVNLDYVDVSEIGDGEDESAQVMIKEGDEVAIIPPCHDASLGQEPGSSGSVSPPPHVLRQPDTRLQPRLHIFFIQPGFFALYAPTFRTAQTTSTTRSPTSTVDAIVTSDVSVVIVETWHPSGRVRTSQRSAQCGQV